MLASVYQPALQGEKKKERKKSLRKKEKRRRLDFLVFDLIYFFAFDLIYLAYICIISFYFVLRKRGRESVSVGERQRKGVRENLKQTPHWVQSPAWD